VVLGIHTSKEVVEVVSRVKMGASQRAKRHMSSAMASTTTGKDVIKKFVGKKGIQSLEIIKEVVTKHSDKKKAMEIENAIIKIAVKAILLWQNKDINEEDLSEVIPLVKALWLDVLNYCQMPFTYDPLCVKAHGDELVVVFCNILMPFVSERTLQLLRDTVGYLEQKELLDIVFEQEAEEGMRKELVRILNADWAKQRFQV